MKKNNKITVFLVLCILFSIFPNSAFGLESRLFFVNNESDLIQLAADCTLDTYSQGLTVILTRDIQISDESFHGIPTFGGTFNGNNHIISNLSMAHEGSTYGLFRYIQTNGVVQNLKIEVDLQLTGMFFKDAATADIYPLSLHDVFRSLHSFIIFIFFKVTTHGTRPNKSGFVSSVSNFTKPALGEKKHLSCSYVPLLLSLPWAVLLLFCRKYKGLRGNFAFIFSTSFRIEIRTTIESD